MNQALERVDTKETDKLFKSTIRHLSRSFDFTRRNYIESRRNYPTIKDDAKSLDRDWKSVGEEMSLEVKSYGREKLYR